jgi:hypothetical protein
MARFAAHVARLLALHYSFGLFNRHDGSIGKRSSFTIIYFCILQSVSRGYSHMQFTDSFF